MGNANKSSAFPKSKRVRYSVRNRVVVGLSIIVMALTGLVSYSIFLYRQTVTEISLVNSTYLPLTLGTSEIRSTQVVFNTLMDRLADDPNQSLTRDWLNAARRYRPATLTKLIRLINDTLKNKDIIPEKELSFLRETKRRLRDVRRRYRVNESKFASLFAALDMGHTEETMQRIEDLKRSERLLNKVLAAIGSDVKQHITEVSQEAVDDGNKATVALGIMSFAALLVGIAIVISTNRLLSPLKRLQSAVSKVASGNLDTQIKINRDDEIGALADNFNKMTNALVERDKMLIRSERLATAGKIAAQVTHEIRNPLSSLGLNAELLEDELGTSTTDGEARALLRAMQDEIERLTGITESYLQFARLPAPNPAFNNINHVIESALAFMKSELSDAQIDIQIKLTDNLRSTVFDKGQIRQGFVNLVRNSIEAMPTGGTVLIETHQFDDETTISVSDNGPGVSPEMISHLFEAFYTTKSAGTGLGLAMVRQICIAHGGNIKYEELNGHGSKFTMILPNINSANQQERKTESQNDK